MKIRLVCVFTHFKGTQFIVSLTLNTDELKIIQLVNNKRLPILFIGMGALETYFAST